MGYLSKKGKCLAFFSGNQGFLLVAGIITGLTINLLTVSFFDSNCSSYYKHAKKSVDINYASVDGEPEFEPRLVKRDPEEIAQKVRFHHVERSNENVPYILCDTIEGLLDRLLQGNDFMHLIENHISIVCSIGNY